MLDTPPAVFAALHVVAAWLGGGGSTTLSAVVTAPLEGGVRAGEAGSRLGNAPGEGWLRHGWAQVKWISHTINCKQPSNKQPAGRSTRLKDH